MPTQKEVDDVKERINQYIEDIGDSVTEEIDNSPQAEAFKCSRGDINYTISFPHDKEYILVTFYYPFLDEIAQKIYLDKANSNLDSKIESEDLDINAAVNFLQTWKEENPNQYEGIRLQLTDYLSNPDCSYLIQTHEKVIRGFQLNTRLFPYHEEISRTQLNNRIETVIGVGIPPQEYLRDLFGIHDVRPLSDYLNSDGEEDLRYFG